MADLYNLMEELDEAQDREDYDDKAKEQQGRPSLAVTEATEPMSSPESHVGASFRRDDSGEDDIEGEEWDTTGQEKLDVPLALQQAEKQRFDTDIDQGDKDLEDLQGELIENDLYKRLQRCWMQERRCPELLPYDEAAIEEIQEKMELGRTCQKRSNVRFTISGQRNKLLPAGPSVAPAPLIFFISLLCSCQLSSSCPRHKLKRGYHDRVARSTGQQGNVCHRRFLSKV